MIMLLKALVLFSAVTLGAVFICGQDPEYVIENNTPAKFELKNVPKTVSVPTTFGSWSYNLPKLSERDKSLISMSLQERERFYRALESGEIGFVRLHDRDGCQKDSRIVDVNDTCPWNVLGKAASYSFRKGKYQQLSFSDILLNKKQIELTGINVLGFFTNIGDINLASVNLQTRGVREVAEYIPSTDIREVEKLYKIHKQGFSINGLYFKDVLPIEENSTYVLRVIAFDGKVYGRGSRFKINLIASDKRDDVIVAFRIINKYQDGSLGILWRELQRRDAPKLKTGKN